jgi:hypothetical protein
MAQQRRDVSQALERADAALLVLERLIENEEVLPFAKHDAIDKLLAEAREAVCTAQSVLGDVRQDMQQRLDRL